MANTQTTTKNIFIPEIKKGFFKKIYSYTQQPNRDVKFAFNSAQDQKTPNYLVVNAGTNWAPEQKVIAKHILSGTDIQTENGRLSYIPKSVEPFISTEMKSVKKIVDGGCDLTTESKEKLKSIFAGAQEARQLFENLMTSPNDPNNSGITSNVQVFKTEKSEFCISWTNGVNGMNGWHEDHVRVFFNDKDEKYGSEQEFVDAYLNQPELN